MSARHAPYNFLNYVQDNQLDFDAMGFNPVDGMVLTQVATMDLSGLGIGILSGSARQFSGLCLEAAGRMDGADRQLLQLLSQSRRFGPMQIWGFVENPAKNGIPGFLSVGEERYMEQFAAVTVSYIQNGQQLHHITYRATDQSDHGWSENLAMLYSDSTQALIDGQAYLEWVAGTTEGPITGGGHSKGGGIFEYSYLFCTQAARSRIVKGYLYDSPGLRREVLAKTAFYEDYLRITDGSFLVPQDCIVGMLLQEAPNAVFVRSVEKGFLQHILYSWEIDPVTWALLPAQQTELSKLLNETLDSAVENMPQDQRRALFDFVSWVLYSDGGEGLENALAFGGVPDNNFERVGLTAGLLFADWGLMEPQERASFRGSLATVTAAIKGTLSAWPGRMREDDRLGEKTLTLLQNLHHLRRKRN